MWEPLTPDGLHEEPPPAIPHDGVSDSLPALSAAYAASAARLGGVQVARWRVWQAEEMPGARRNTREAVQRNRRHVFCTMRRHAAVAL